MKLTINYINGVKERTEKKGFDLEKIVKKVEENLINCVSRLKEEETFFFTDETEKTTITGEVIHKDEKEIKIEVDYVSAKPIKIFTVN